MVYYRFLGYMDQMVVVVEGGSEVASGTGCGWVTGGCGWVTGETGFGWVNGGCACGLNGPGLFTGLCGGNCGGWPNGGKGYGKLPWL